MKTIIIRLVGGDDSSLQTTQQAAHAAFASTQVRSCAQLSDALMAKDRFDLLLLLHPTLDQLTQALHAQDSLGLPKCGVLALAAQTSLPLVVVVSELNPATLVAPLQQALAIHQLRRENARLRDDLATFGHRISHDLRSQLGGILSSAEVLKEIAGESDPSVAPLVTPICTSADALGRIIEQSSFIAKASAAPKLPADFNMQEVVTLAIQRMEAQLWKQQLKVIQPKTWARCFAVPAWTELIWRNLLSNALQHGGPAPRIELGWDPLDTEVRFWVKDSGPGVGPEKSIMLFQPFNRLHLPNSASGLGLSLVQRLVELQNGSCDYAPASEGATAFRFTLPAGGPPQD